MVNIENNHVYGSNTDSTGTQYQKIKKEKSNKSREVEEIKGNKKEKIYKGREVSIKIRSKLKTTQTSSLQIKLVYYGFSTQNPSKYMCLFKWNYCKFLITRRSCKWNFK